ncbi:MAG TPA: gamma-glutamyltransferase [Rhizomicrobium sp.]|nr:gamma-glutamyltransferase [Rhizomicrobium sp.]
MRRFLPPTRSLPCALVCTAALLIVTACSSSDDSGTTAPSGGYAVGDEPFAVKAATSILAQGGSAADAATAMFFTLSVTYPVAAGLGGGGICVVHDQATGRNEVFNFLARDTASQGAFAIPGNVAGFAALQAAYGNMPWQRDVSPAEQYAATGFPISSALSDRLGSAQDVVRLDAGLAREFLNESGAVRPAGQIATNTDLASTLAAIRVGGADAFYRGNIAAKISGYTSTQNGAISIAELANYQVHREMPRVVALGGELGYLPPEQIGAGAFAGTLLSRLVDSEGNIVTGDHVATATASATKAALDQFGISELPRDLGATGFAVVDNSGQAVSCAVTLDGPFGSGHTVPGTGITLARSPSSGQTGIAAAFLTPALATDGQGGSVMLAGAGAGGPNGTAAIAYALLRLARGVDMTQPDSVRSTGIAPYDTVNVITCQGGICATLPDPQAHGLGAAAGNVTGAQ